MVVIATGMSSEFDADVSLFGRCNEFMLCGQVC